VLLIYETQTAIGCAVETRTIKRTLNSRISVRLGTSASETALRIMQAFDVLMAMLHLLFVEFWEEWFSEK
jgi:hypothetical protein